MMKRFILPDFRVEIFYCASVWLRCHGEPDRYEGRVECFDILTVDEQTQLIFTLEGEVHQVAEKSFNIHCTLKFQCFTRK